MPKPIVKGSMSGRENQATSKVAPLGEYGPSHEFKTDGYACPGRGPEVMEMAAYQKRTAPRRRGASPLFDRES